MMILYSFQGCCHHCSFQSVEQVVLHSEVNAVCLQMCVDYTVHHMLLAILTDS